MRALHGFGQKLESMLALSEAQAQFVHGKLNYLQSAVKRQGRTDWIYTAIGVLGSVLVAIGADPARAAEVWKHFAQVVEPLISRAVHLP